VSLATARYTFCRTNLLRKFILKTNLAQNDDFEREYNKLGALFYFFKMSKNRTIKHSFRVTEDEQAKLKDEMQKSSFSSFSKFIRFKCLLDVDTQTHTLKAKSLKDELKNFNYEMNKIGNNINQITKAIYTNNIDHSYAIEEVKSNMNKLIILAEKLNSFQK